MNTLWKDLRYAFRLLAKSPGFVAVAVITLGLGIGANSTIFSWVNATLLNPIPGLLRGNEVVAVTRGAQGNANPMSYPDFLDLREGSRSFAGLSGFALWPMSLTGNGKPVRVWGSLVTANYFDVLGVRPILGTTSLPGDDRSPNGTPLAVISHRLWQERFGGDPSIVGQTLHIDTHPYTIIGVTPRVFQGSYTGLRLDIWVPVTMLPQLIPEGGEKQLTTRGANWLNSLGRLRQDVNREQAQAELSTLFQQIARQYPDTHKGQPQITLYPLWRAPNGANYFFSRLLPILMGLAGVVLLLACANIANLLLARGVSRKKELAIRLSLGATRPRLVSQLLIENLLLSLAGGGLALLLTLQTSASFMQFAPITDLPIWISVDVDRSVFLVTLCLSVLTAVLFGILPALRASGMNPMTVLKDESGNVSGGLHRSRLSNGLAVAQVALSLLLLVSAGLFIRSFRAAQSFNLGFNPSNVLLESYDLFLNGYPEAKGIAFDRQVLQEIGALPSVQNVSLADWVPLGFSSNSDSFVPEGYVAGPHEDVQAGVAHVSPGYFATLQIPLTRGRDFAPQDSTSTQPVAIVNEAVASRYWPQQDPIGKRIQVEGKWATIIGVARTADYFNRNEAPQRFLYLSLYQFYSPGVTVHVRTAGDPLHAAAAVAETIHELNADLPLFDVSTLDVRVLAASFVQRMAGTFVGAFGLLALILAAVGIYGVIAYSTRQRTHEIGVRMALGAEPRTILTLVLRQGAKLAVAGVIIGLVGSLAVTRLMSGLLFGVSASDPVTFLAVVVLLAAVALLACYVPARRATRVDPLVALRYE